MPNLPNGQDIADDRKGCARCDKMLPLAAFTPKPHLRSGYDSWCRGCRVRDNRAYRARRRGAAAG